MGNWFFGSAVSRSRYSQSENCLAFSDDFSEKDEIVIESGSAANLKDKAVALSSTSEYSLPPSIVTETASSQARAYPQLSWQRRCLLLPSYTLIFMALLPFLQGCLYTVGYRVGKRVLKIVINPISE